MIGKGKSIAHISQAVDYALKKDKAEVLEMKGVFATNGKEIETQFDAIGANSERLKNKGMSFVLSPTPEDGSALSDAKYREITEEFTKKMEMSNNQWIAIKHMDKDHTHIHLFVNRKDMNGKVYKDNFVGKRSQFAADKVAQEHGLTRAKEVQLKKDELHKNLKQEIFKTHKEILKQKPINFSDYSKKMQSKGIEIIPSINKSGKLQGYRVAKNGLDFKASAINRSMTLSKMGVNTLQIAKGIINPVLKISSKFLNMTKGNELEL